MPESNSGAFTPYIVQIKLHRSTSCGKAIKVEKNKPLITLKPINPQPSFQPQTFVRNLKGFKASQFIVQHYKVIIAVLCVGILFLSWWTTRHFHGSMKIRNEETSVNTEKTSIKTAIDITLRTELSKGAFLIVDYAIKDFDSHLEQLVSNINTNTKVMNKNSDYKATLVPIIIELAEEYDKCLDNQNGYYVKKVYNPVYDYIIKDVPVGKYLYVYFNTTQEDGSYYESISWFKSIKVDNNTQTVSFMKDGTEMSTVIRIK